MRSPASEPEGYERRRPEQTDLHRLVSAWLPALLERSEEAGGLPSFVKETFESYLRCGVLAHGFARVRCPTCHDDLLVAWSCQRRGLCPSCSGRRMVDTAAHLVDRVLPEVPVRQWVVTLPFELRALVAFDSDLNAAVRTLFVQTVSQAYRARASRAGLGEARTGSVTVTQRFGSALNLNPHHHALLLDGVYHRPKPGGPLVFAPHPRLTDADVADVLEVFRRKLTRLLISRGYADSGPEDPDEQPTAMTQLSLSALGMGAGVTRRQDDSLGGSRAWPRRHRARRRRIQRPPKPLCADQAGFTLHAATATAADRRGDLEVLCRYILRPAIANDRVAWRDDGDGMVEWTLPRPWSDGTTRLLFEPLTFLARLAVLIPKPYLNEVAYHGVLAPAARWRPEIVARAAKAGGLRRPTRPCDAEVAEDQPQDASPVRPRRLDWASLLWRSFTADILTCAKCGSRRKVLALIQDPTSIRAILQHLGLAPTPPPPASSPRAPPQGSLDLSATP
jgi:hypothetical protein